MEDSQIVALYWDRCPDAISETARKYGNYCTSISMNILGDYEDAQECVNDTYLSAWNAMPPHRPGALAAFLGKLTRNLSFNRYKLKRAQKRGAGEILLVLEELSDCVSGTEDVEQALDRQLLMEAIHDFLRGLPKDRRGMFLCRYWYADNIRSIAERYGVTEGNVSVILGRLRTKLRAYLTERGFTL